MPVAASLSAPGSALAQASVIAPHEVWSAWSTDPVLLAGLGLLGWLYGRGVVSLWRQQGRGRVVRPGQAAAFSGGLLTLGVALVSPLDALGHTLLSAHMVQHLLLTVVAAPLLVIGAPLVPVLAALPHRARRSFASFRYRCRGVRALADAPGWPLAVVGLHAAVMWGWHLPGPYQAAVTLGWVHALEHGFFLGTAVLLWWTVARSGAHASFGYGMGALVVFLTALAGGGLGAVIAFAPSPFYPVYAPGAAAWGTTPLADQQFAGMLMWMPGKVVYVVAAVVLAILWIRDTEARLRRREAALPPAASAVPGTGGEGW